MIRTMLWRAIGVGLCAVLVFSMAACGGGGGGASSYTGNGGTGGGYTPPPPALLINTSQLPYAIVGQAYSQPLTASGGTPPYTWSQTGVYPQGMTFDAAKVAVTGTPAYQGNFGLGVQVTDSGSPKQTATQMVSFQIYPPLVITTTTLPAAHLGVPYSVPLNATGSFDPTSWKVVSGTFPPGLQIANPQFWQAEIDGTATQTGSYPITIQVQDVASPPQVQQQNLTLVVDNGLGIVTRTLGAALQNTNYSASVTAVGGTPPYQWSAIGLPVGLAINPNTGAISGVPPVSGIFQPTITVTDAAGSTLSQGVGMTVIATLSIPNYGNQSVVVNRPFYDALYAFGGVPPYSWSMVSGALPPGLSLMTPGGYITGTASQLGSSNVTFQVTDSGTPQQTAQWATTFTVVPPQLNVTGTLPPKFPLGVPVQWSPGAQGGTPPYHWNAATGNLPPGLSFDPNTGDLTGTPTTVGQYTFQLSATDSGSPPQTANSSFTANVTTPLGRNDTISHATAVGDGSWLASISPYADPPDSPTPAPDHDYYRIIGAGGSTVKVWTVAKAYSPSNPLDTVLEFVDGNGARLSTCRQPGDTSNNFNSPCLNDDIVKGVQQDSQLEILLPGGANTDTTFYAHVFDWRGNARPDMWYYLGVNGSVAPLVVTAPSAVNFGGGYWWGVSACPVGQACSANFTASGGNAPLTWSLDSGSVPAGMAIDPVTGTLSGTPTTSGSYTMVVRATDSALPPQTATASYTLAVETPPQIATTSLPHGQTGQPYNTALAASGGTPPYKWGLSGFWDGSLQFDQNSGTISGTPSFTGTYDVFISVIDALGLTGGTHLTLTIDAGPFSFVSGSYPDAKVGVMYVNSGPHPVGGTTPYNVVLASGTLPPGLTLGNNGGLVGTPTTAGTYTFTLTATDSSTTPQSGTATATITVAP